MKVLGIIPVRYHSIRFPEKALVDIRGKSMVQRVYEKAMQARGLHKVIVATDHPKIFDHAREFDGEVCMTSSKHPSGTDRCREVMELESTSYDFVVNIQGDEPFINPNQIEDLIKSLTSEVEIATQIKTVINHEKLLDPNCVKVLTDFNGNSIYFSRAPLPFQKNVALKDWMTLRKYYEHVGIYAYRSDVLRKITELPVSPLEQAEGLEQLRWLENGYKINVLETEYHGYGIDTPEDLKKALAFKHLE